MSDLISNVYNSAHMNHVLILHKAKDRDSLHDVCSNANPLHYYTLRVPHKAEKMALSVVYFQITNHWGRPHYIWDEYRYSVL